MGGAESREPIEVRVLGPFDVAVGDRRVELSSNRLRVLLAVLAMSNGRAVPIERLVDAVWDDELPTNARRTVQTYITRLRSALGGAHAITTEPAGYVLRAMPDNVDALRFERLLERAAIEPATERSLLGEALALWRGQPFEDLGSQWLSRTEAGRLEERRLSALERRIDLDIAAGRANEVVPELQDLVTRHPLREPLWARLMIALALSGRFAEAVGQYEAVRTRIADDLGVDPGAEIQAIHADLLAGSPPTLQTANDTAINSVAAVPRQLPADIPAFTGRADLLAELDAKLTEGREGANPRAVVVAVSGSGGTGKTALSVHWAHRNTAAFPDGQLYLNLRGFGPERPMAPSSALDLLLRGLGVPGERIPADVEGRSSLLRSRLADRKLLMILDNARDGEQVRPLLPGGGGIFAIVTSRTQLRGLVAREGARRISVDSLRPQESMELLTSVLGSGRAEYEDDALAELAWRCGHLPLALAVAGERASRQPETGLAELLSDLRVEQDRLDAFDAGSEAATDLRAVFAWSYQALDAETARLFRLLGLHPGPDVGVHAAAVLAGVSAPSARRFLDRLADSNLLQYRRAGRYELHDLLKAYAIDVAEATTSTSERDASLDRVLAWYVHTVANGRRQLSIRDPKLGGVEAPTEVLPLTFDGAEQAHAWFEVERPVLLAAVDLAAATGRDRLAFHLTVMMATFLMRRRGFDDLFAVLTIAAEGGRRLADPGIEAQCASQLGVAHAELAEYQQAHAYFEDALTGFAADGDARGQLTALDNLGVTSSNLGRMAESTEYHERALLVARELEDPRESINPLNNLASNCVELGDYDLAVDRCQEAIEICQRLQWEHVDHSMLWDTLALARAGQRRYDEAFECFERALGLARQAQDRWNECIILTNLGRCLRDAGEPDRAKAAWSQALSLVDQMGTPEGMNLSRDDLVRLLDGLEGRTSGGVR